MLDSYLVASPKELWGAQQQQVYATWYEPFVEQKVIDACVHFILKFSSLWFASEEDIHLYPFIIDAINR
jgi:hypothetical protein